MSHTAWLIIYCVLILLASLAGGWIPMLVKLTHKRMELAVSFVAGVMLGVGLLHMLPHALSARAQAMGENAEGLAADHWLAHDVVGPIMLWLLAGFLVMFFAERFFRFHHHDVPGTERGANDHAAAHDHDHQCEHAHDDGNGAHGLTWAGAAVGLSLHSLIEGVALASAVAVAHDGDDHGQNAALAGLGTFLVIFLHKPFDSLTLGTLMTIGGRTLQLRHAVNIAFSLLIPMGVLLFYLGLAAAESQGLVASAALAFSAGTFLCISMSDLLPELQFHHHDRGKLSAALLSGLAVAWLVGVLEGSMHDHNDLEHKQSRQTDAHDHPHR